MYPVLRTVSNMLKWIEVNLGNVAYNTRQLRKFFNKNSKLIVAVKADGYGHGAVEIARVVLKNGADMLAVANIDEALKLRKAKIKAPILILNWTEPVRLKEIVKNNLTQTIFDYCSAFMLSAASVKMKKKTNIHVKIDTGMGRLGVPYKEVYEFTKRISGLNNLRIEGIFSHFSVAECDKGYTFRQFKNFKTVIDKLERSDIKIPLKHIANSAALINYPGLRLNCARAGISVYGVSPWGKKNILRFLKPAMSFKAKVASVKIIIKGDSVSYGRTFIAKRRSVIADIPVGYANGYQRSLSNKAFVLIKGRQVPVIGTICMDQCLIDVTGIKNVKPGDEVVLFGCQGKNEIRVEEVAQWAGTIGYEIITNIGRLVERIYIK